MELHTISIDLGKTVFHLVGLNLHGEVVVRKKFSRTQLLRFTANVHVELIGMEACGGAHALVQWVEKGSAPNYIIATHFTVSTIDSTRPLCPYPKIAHWNGSGSSDDARNFTCLETTNR